MARYAIGDIQGCLQPLQQLLRRCDFEPGRDELWLVGDLVNRGPDSLGVLRYLYPLRDSIRLVLGNHDLHLLALAHGVGKAEKEPDLKAILDAPDAADLLAWLQGAPVVYRDKPGGWLMVHAGLAPEWSADKALALSAELASVLQSNDAGKFFQQMYGNTPARWDDNLQGWDRLRAITNFSTRLRYLTTDHHMDFACKGVPGQQPPELLPWFDVAPSQVRDERILFGHWAALNGETGIARVVGLDTGCVWGGCMSLMNLDNDEILRCDCDA